MAVTKAAGVGLSLRRAPRKIRSTSANPAAHNAILSPAYTPGVAVPAASRSKRIRMTRSNTLRAETWWR